MGTVPLGRKMTAVEALKKESKTKQEGKGKKLVAHEFTQLK